MAVIATLYGGQELARRLNEIGERARPAMVRAMTRATILLQNHVKSDKLSGQVLKNRTGTLRRSINQEVEDRGDEIVGIVGTNVEYAAIHEFGFTGQESVREHLRRTLRGETTVRSYLRQMNMPERSFLRSALADYEDQLTSELRRGLEEAIGE
jgi:HK97 gp10 family phage protein